MISPVANQFISHLKSGYFDGAAYTPNHREGMCDAHFPKSCGIVAVAGVVAFFIVAKRRDDVLSDT